MSRKAPPTLEPPGGPDRVSMTGALVAVVVVGAGVFGFGAMLGALGAHPYVLRAKTVRSVTPPPGATKVATISLATYPDSLAGEHGKGGGAHPNWVSYGPTTNLQVPAHALVKMTIRNYDSATPLNSPFFGNVQGTVGGVAKYNGVARSSINPTQVAHTFTIHMFPTAGQPPLDVSVPLLGVPGNANDAPNSKYPKPEVVTFEFRTGASGRYIWQCFDPCGGSQYYAGFGGPMQNLGYMAGTITVGSGASA
ncbi:MAG: hypothetical protein M0Z87_10080 [Actinomycetota bacterium]|nr:hypothetical protein [Actinomycetota bacterium]